ncbi:DUF3693 domain-containing protein [Thaumasiovibrio sp. DFM-14]|uniref:DUF3693 domain-containing protein n=1 Tax=Thaumasiovibrio sp. DFM-14 TaxID=3384792 RepID=UPI0039A09DBB
MYARQLLDAYKKAKNYTQDKQVAEDLGLTKARVCEIRKGTRYVSDEEAIFLAIEAEIDPSEALVGVHRDRAKSAHAKHLWGEIAKKLNSQTFQVLAVGMLAMPSLISKYTLCMLC